MFLFPLLLFSIKLATDRFCRRLDGSSLGAIFKSKNPPLDKYKNFLIQLYYYMLPGPELLARDVRRMEKEGDAVFMRYLKAHLQVENDLSPIVLRDLEDLGVSYPKVKRANISEQIEKLNKYVETLHTDPDPVFILVSDIAAKVLLDYYTPKIIEAIKATPSDSSKGISFLTKDTKAQEDMKTAMIDIVKDRLTLYNHGRFIKELGTIFIMFEDWLNTI